MLAAMTDAVDPDSPAARVLARVRAVAAPGAVVEAYGSSVYAPAHASDVDVLVRAQEDDRTSVESIRRLIVNPGSSRPVTLAELVAQQRERTGQPAVLHDERPLRRVRRTADEFAAAA